jgi:hypothetical protein
MLASMCERHDAAGCAEVLRNMRLAGIAPDPRSYHLAIAAAVGAHHPHAAVRLCAEGHDAGPLRHYEAPDPARARGVPRGQALGNAVDLRGLGVEVGVTAMLTWLTRVAQLLPLGLTVADRSVRVVLGGGCGPACGPPRV